MTDGSPQRAHMPGWVRPALTLGLGGLYALAALASGLDRLAGDSVDVARIVPAAFHANAARTMASAALAAGHPAQALAAARRAVRHDSLEAGGIGLLAQAAADAGDTALSGRAFAAAARLGWREPFAQLHAMDTALARGDWTGAAAHVDAMLRQSPRAANRNLLLAPFDAAPAGRAALAARLALNPAWARGYFADTALEGAGDPSARAQVGLRLARGGMRDCGLVAPTVEGLLRHGHYADALRLRAGHCDASSQAALPVDGRFLRADVARPPTVLDWRFADEGAIDVTLAARPGFPGRAANVGNAASVTLAFAEQPMMLPPGDYRINWRAADAAGAPSPAIRLALSCEQQGASWLDASGGDQTRTTYQAAVSVPAACPRQRLVLGIAGGARDIAVGAITIAPSPATTRPRHAPLDKLGPAG